MTKSKLIAPVLFSKFFKISPEAIAAAGLFDPVLNCDSKLFIDPLLFAGSDVKILQEKGHALLREHFGHVVRLLAASNSHGDIAWRSAAKLLNLKERRETCLGYGGSGTSGSSRPEELRERILSTAKEIIQLGESDPEIISLMGMFEEGVGADTISDLSTNAILPVLAEITEAFCKEHGIASQKFEGYEGMLLPENPYTESLPLILVPRDILRDLPLAADMSDVGKAALQNERIRDRFNLYVANITKATVREKKEAMRQTALESLKNFREIFHAVLGASDAYDPQADPMGLYRFRQIMGSDLSAFKSEGFQVGKPGQSELKRIVTEIIVHFRHMVERNNLWELLWNGDVPRRERAAQLAFFAVADMFCKANNIDIAPETNPGGGPVDFRFSRGYRNRIIVEIKLSKGRVVHGYTHQTEIYAAASKTDDAVFLIVNVGAMGEKLDTIKETQRLLRAANKPAPGIELVDARRRRSASTRGDINEVIDDSVTEEED